MPKIAEMFSKFLIFAETGSQLPGLLTFMTAKRRQLSLREIALRISIIPIC
ncbi:hypothetical protein [Candidatus Methylospira mobilis]|uniref:hypothetical protein n=1 Tax=Candidatus Methylospira mobilis TaxID=1808979 RepID=UPI0012930511|nr:hypothetical protein [Candidatus Methylospira mobilis]